MTLQDELIKGNEKESDFSLPLASSYSFSYLCFLLFFFKKKKTQEKEEEKPSGSLSRFILLTDGILFLLDHEKLMKENVNRPEEMKCSWQVIDHTLRSIEIKGQLLIVLVFSILTVCLFSLEKTGKRMVMMNEKTTIKRPLITGAS